MISKDSSLKTNNRNDDKVCDFREFKTTGSFTKGITIGTITLDMTDEERSDLLDKILTFNGSKVTTKIKKKSKTKKVKRKKEIPTKERVLNVLKNGIFKIETTQGIECKVLSPNQILQKLSIALAFKINVTIHCI